MSTVEREAKASKKRKNEKVEEKRKSKKPKTEELAHEDVNGNGAAVHEDKTEQKNDRRKERQEKKKRKKEQRIIDQKDLLSEPDWTWTLSKPIGGRFAALNPVFSEDEKYLFLATRHYVSIYSTSTSLIVRRLQVNGQQIVALTLSPTNPQLLYVADSNGSLQVWTWATGEKVQDVQYSNTIRDLTVVPNKSSTLDKVYFLADSQESKGATEFVTFDVEAQEASPFDSLHTTSQYFNRIQVVNRGQYIIAASSKSFLIGYNEKWKSFQVADEVTSFNARITERSHEKVRKSTLTLAIGCNTGAIFLYENLNETLEKNSPLNMRKFHWHRKTVSSINFSNDGNYLISGGLESVMVLWQMDTNRQQYLPHLTAPITHIVVSPNGSSYGVRLEDNSVIVLSTSELSPTTAIAGIQTPSANIDYYTLRHLHETPIQLLAATSSALHPDQLLFAVPQGTRSQTPFLQTYDWTTDRHVSRQALTRNNTTIVNVGPKGTTISEPTVTLIKTSHDGSWLATVEEWLPEPSDLQNRETYIKFWSYNDLTSVWSLQTRIDAPHQAPPSFADANRILDIAVSPNTSAFATLGQDATIRIWTPKTRKRDGHVVKGAKIEEGTVVWLCTREVHIGYPASISDLEGTSSQNVVPPVGKLCWSDDSSLIVASLDVPNAAAPGLVHFIETSTGAIKSTQSLMYSSDLAGMALLGRHLILLSTDLRVWDIVDNTLIFGYPLKQNISTADRIRLASHLAVSRSTDTFAIAFPATVLGGGTEINSKVAVWDAKGPKPKMLQEVPGTVVGLLDLAGPGFALVDEEGEVRLLRPDGIAMIDAVKLGASLDKADNAEGGAVQDIEMRDEEDGEEESDGDDEDEDDNDGEDQGEYKPVVGTHQLGEIFNNGPAFALPPVGDLFKAVAGLYIGRKKQEVRSD